MEARHFGDTKTVYIELADRPAADAQVLGDGAVIVGVDAAGLPVSVTLELGLIGSLPD